MKKICCYMVVALLFQAPAWAQVDLKLRSGYQFSSLNFSIAGNLSGTSPNVFSELKWQEVGQRSHGLSVKANLFPRIVASAQFNNLNIKKGKVSDIDYASDHRKDVFARFYGVTDGFERNLAASLGYLVFQKDRFGLTASLSYFGQFQKNYLLNAEGTSFDSHPSVYIENLNSYYRTNWNGVGPALSFAIKPLPSFEVAAGLAAYALKNRGYGNWNVRTELAQPKSYLHSANGYALLANMDLNYVYRQQWLLGISANYKYGLVKNGTDDLRLANGNSALTKLNEVEFEAIAYNLSLGFRF